MLRWTLSPASNLTCVGYFISSWCCRGGQVPCRHHICAEAVVLVHEWVGVWALARAGWAHCAVLVFIISMCVLCWAHACFGGEVGRAAAAKIMRQKHTVLSLPLLWVCCAVVMVVCVEAFLGCAMDTIHAV
jgi:hypothetical protein